MLIGLINRWPAESQPDCVANTIAIRAQGNCLKWPLLQQSLVSCPCNRHTMPLRLGDFDGEAQERQTDDGIAAFCRHLGELCDLLNAPYDDVNALAHLARAGELQVRGRSLQSRSTLKPNAMKYFISAGYQRKSAAPQCLLSLAGRARAAVRRGVQGRRPGNDCGSCSGSSFSSNPVWRVCLTVRHRRGCPCNAECRWRTGKYACKA